MPEWQVFSPKPSEILPSIITGLPLDNIFLTNL